jgi:hypothetical protein
VEDNPETLAMLGKLHAAKKRDFGWYAARAAALLALIALLAWPADLFDLGNLMHSSDQPAEPQPVAAPAPEAPVQPEAPAQLPVAPATQLAAPGASTLEIDAPPQVMPLPEPAELSDEQLSVEAERVAGKTSPEDERAERRVNKRRTEKPAARPRPAQPQPQPVAPQSSVAPLTPRASDNGLVAPQPLEISPNLETRKPPAPRRTLDALPANPY